MKSRPDVPSSHMLLEGRTAAHEEISLHKFKNNLAVIVLETHTVRLVKLEE